MPKWTLEKIELACRREMRRSRVRFGRIGGDWAGLAEWAGEGPLEARIDPFLAGGLRALIHELIHRVLDKELAPFRDYNPKRKRDPQDAQEVMVEALEDAIFKRIKHNKGVVSWWRRAIAKRGRGLATAHRFRRGRSL